MAHLNLSLLTALLFLTKSVLRGKCAFAAVNFWSSEAKYYLFHVLSCLYMLNKCFLLDV